MNTIKFIKLDNIFQLTKQETNNNIINILKQLKLEKNNIYIGSILNNRPSRNAFLHTKNNLLIKGYFDGNFKNIQDCNIELDNIILKGNIINEYFNNGTIIYKKTNEEFIGEFNTEGIPNGYCIYTNNDTNISYEGQWINGNFNDIGTYKCHDFEYTGLFNNNLFNGLGKIIYYNNYSFEGSFKDNMKHGNGKYIDIKNNKEFYTEFFNDKNVLKITYIQKENEDLKNQLKSLNNLLSTNEITINNKNKDIEDYKNKLQDLKKNNDELHKKGKCVICFNNHSNTILNCNHLCICDVCELRMRASSSRRCPICRKTYLISNVKKIIIS
jgi:hypothetical protein